MSATYSYSSSMCKKIQIQGITSSFPIAEEETMLLQKQGIVTVLGSDINNRNRACAANSLRRTLSAGMSSKKWLSHDSSFSSSSEPESEEVEEAEEERFQIWSTIQRDKKEQDDDEINPPAPAKLDTWSSILFDKAKEAASNNDLVTSYIHPLAKRSKSSLSEKSLEICTESLGSETGSDHVFSSDNSNSSPSSESEDSEDEKEQQQHEEEEEEQLRVAKQNLHHHVVTMKKSAPRCFPPPLPSHHMRSHRDGNGRLFLDAVTVSASQSNKFCAQRQDGRLVLTFASDDDQEEEEKNEVEELEEEFVGFEEDDDVEEGKEYEEDENYDAAEELEDEVVEVEEVEAVIEKAPLLSSVQRLALMMNKPIGVINRKTKNWSKKFNEVVNFDEEEQQQHGLVAQSLPPRPRVVARLIPSAPSPPLAPVASLNAYDCYWGTNKHNDRGSKVIVYSSGDDHQQQKLVVMRGKNGDYLVHNSKGCKDSRRSFLFWEPRCIATS